MSWYSGSQETPACASSAGMMVSIAATFESTFAWVRATAFGSTVVPLENWMTSRLSGLARSASGGPCGTRCSPKGGRACAIATPSRRETRGSLSTTRAPHASSIRAVRRWYSSMRPRRSGG